jgi:invasion protein IalB
MTVSRYPVRRRVLPAAAVASTMLIAAASQSAPAQAPDAPPPAAWRVECSGDGKVLECRAVQQVFHRETRQLLLSVAVRPTLVQAIQTCTNVGCFVAMTLSDKLVAAMRTGTDLKITVQDANKKPVEMSLPLLGFALAFDKAK